MKAWIMIGLICGVTLTVVTVAYATDMIPTSRHVAVNGRLLGDAQVQVASDGTTMTSTRTIAEALGAQVTWNEGRNTVEISHSNVQPNVDASYMSSDKFVSLLLHGKYSFKYEVMGTNLGEHSNTTVVFAEGYADVPNNTDFQKMFLLLLVDQLGDTSSKRIEFWSNKEQAEAYVTGNYHNDGIEGWSGMNARFGLLTNEDGNVSLSHILSVHERDSVSIGKYKPQ